ncbi:MAG: GTP 3',8-cyclase MoaA [Lachnospiraceae bacterium]|nr:GTP 3',8-cyclase MoaA [Lachnospiraceae bacterium]
MTDGFGRTIDYLRISVTDKCNLRCKYCMPSEGIDFIPHEELLSLEEIFRLVRIMEGMGITKVRITGGEPLVRKNLIKLIKDINSLSGVKEIAMTTNGVLLGECVKELKEAGLTGVNISLDTTDAEHFAEITGADAADRVLESIDAALQQGLRVKLNCVPCREWNDADIENIALLAKEQAVDVRYIELMPVGCGRNFTGIPSDEILNRLEAKYGPAKESAEKRGNGPAKYYDLEGFQGKIGFISPISHKFCSECNRIRLTAEGRLKLCLHYNHGLELKPLLRGGASDEEIKLAIKEALMRKPMAHDFAHADSLADSEKRKMVQIGG